MTKDKVNISPSVLRILAFITDFIIVSLFCKLGLIPFVLEQDWDLADNNEIWVGVLPAYFLALVFFILRDAFGGAGFGKRFLNIRTAKAVQNFPTPSIIDQLKRNITLLLLPIEIYRLLFNPLCRRLGDALAGTIVIEKALVIARIRFVSIRVLSLFAAAGFLWLTYIFAAPYQLKKTAYYRVAAEAVLANVNYSLLEDGVQPEITEISYIEGIYYIELELQHDEEKFVFDTELIKTGNTYQLLDLKPHDGADEQMDK